MKSVPEGSQIRIIVYGLLNPAEHSTLFDLSGNLLIIAMVLINLAAMALETEASIAAAFTTQFFFLELFSVAFFTVEYALRIWSSNIDPRYHTRLRYITSLESTVDLLAILPFYIGLLLDIDLRFFIAFRLFRLFKLFRYFSPLVVLANVLQAEARSFFAAILVMLVLVFIAATGVYFFEADAQPESLGSIPRAMWWSIVSLTTLGYGDVVPITLGGRVFAGAMTLCAIGIVALPAGMLASRFSEELDKRKSEFGEFVTSLLESDLPAADEEFLLEQKRQTLCLSRHDAKLLKRKTLERADTKQNSGTNFCPHCGESLHVKSVI